MRIPLLLILVTTSISAQKFYRDDPLHREPPPKSVKEVLARDVEDWFDFLHNTLVRPGDRSETPAQAVNTLGEPMDGAWYTQRHYFKRMTHEQLALGPGGRTPPADGPWTVVKAKSQGITPGFTIVDRNGRMFFLKFDPPTNMEMATAADMISGRFFHALGYHVADQYLVSFDESRLVLGKNVKVKDYVGKTRPMTRRDLLEILLKTRPHRDGKFRALASHAIEGKGVGPFRYFGRRKDDPNDLAPHEHRRDLRGLNVFAAWLGHDDSRAVNTYDTLVSENGRQFIRHYLLDFGSTLGSGSTRPNSPRSGGEYLFSWGLAAKNIFTLGLIVPAWARAYYPIYPSIGLFEGKMFDPVRWVPEYPNAAFENRLPDDEFWAAKQVMAFTDEDIRAIVRTGEYSDPAAADYLVRTLALRRDKIGRAFLERVLSLDRFEVRGEAPVFKLAFEDLGLKHGTAKSREFKVAWFEFDNVTGGRTPVTSASGFEFPRAKAQYVGAEITEAGGPRAVTVYFRNAGLRPEVVGVERRW
ncbi:MAG TPA: hypothetical protein VN428_24820 [Bryobacteraceae bacterium]|nr:hypothetical protein [Bryobacteraceae bacterium]